MHPSPSSLTACCCSRLTRFPCYWQLPADKKKKSGKGKGKGKGKKATEPAAGDGGGARLRLQEALSGLGWEVSELLRAMSTGLKVLVWVVKGCGMVPLFYVFFFSLCL